MNFKLFMDSNIRCLVYNSHPVGSLLRSLSIVDLVCVACPVDLSSKLCTVPFNYNFSCFDLETLHIEELPVIGLPL